MKTWLFTWNKEKYAWDDIVLGYSEMIDEINQIGYSITKWNCHHNKKYNIGDRFFLIKLGSYPKGIVASGTIASVCFEGSHPVYEDKTINRIYLKFDRIYDYEIDTILDYNELLKLSSSFNWSTQLSGILIPASLSMQLERKWNELDSEHFLNNFGVSFVQDRNNAMKNIELLKYVDILEKWDFKLIKKMDTCYEYQNVNTKEIVYMVLQDRLNIVTQPSIVMDRYIGFLYHNSTMTRFCKRYRNIYYGMKYDFLDEWELETFLKDLNKETQQIEYDVKNHWILSVSPNIYDHVSSFNKNGFIDWHQYNNYDVGDMVMIYSSSPKKRMIACAQVIKVNLTKEEKMKDREFWYKEDDYMKNEEKNRFVRLKLRYFVNDDLLTFAHLKEHGLKNAPQCAMLINEELYQYIYTVIESD